MDSKQTYLNVTSDCLNIIISLMCKYDDETLEPIPPILEPGEKEHIVLAQDETNIATNEGPCCMWFKGGQQPLVKKGNG